MATIIEKNLFILYSAAAVIIMEKDAADAFKRAIKHQGEDPDEALQDVENAVEWFRPTARCIMNGENYRLDLQHE